MFNTAGVVILRASDVIQSCYFIEYKYAESGRGEAWSQTNVVNEDALYASHAHPPGTSFRWFRRLTITYKRAQTNTNQIDL